MSPAKNASARIRCQQPISTSNPLRAGRTSAEERRSESSRRNRELPPRIELDDEIRHPWGGASALLSIVTTVRVRVAQLMARPGARYASSGCGTSEPTLGADKEARP